MLKKLLQRIFPVFALTTALMPLSAAADPATSAPVNPSGFIIRRGVNLSHWLSQDFGWCAKSAWITRSDIHYIAALGYDHVRLPVDEKELWNEDGTKNEAAFRMLKEGIEWSRAEHLRVILDLHTTRSHHFNAAESGGHNTLFTDPAALKHFISLWDDLMAAVGNVPNSELAYEIMNEPTADNPEDWNHLVATAMKAIRAKEPNRVIVIGANLWQIPQSFPYLKVPEGDRNIILSFHTYEPIFFTHHTANWVLGPIQDYRGPVNYPGPIIDKATYDRLSAESADKIKHPLEKSVLDNWGPDRIRKEIEPAIIRAKELNLQLFCGEFGCLPTVPREARLAYYRDIVGVFESEGIAWCNWEYKGDFGIYEWHGEKYLTGAPDLEMIGALLGTKCPAKVCPAPACPMKK